MSSKFISGKPVRAKTNIDKYMVDGLLQAKQVAPGGASVTKIKIVEERT